jgi:single-strand DNA-binding protein
MNGLTNSCRFVGRLGQDVELKYLPSGNAVAKIGLAVRVRVYRNEKYEYDTTWVDLVAYGKLAENMADLLKKGSKIFVDTEYKKNTVKNEEKGTRVYHSFQIREFEILDSKKTDGNGNGESKGAGRRKTEDEEEDGDDAVEEDEYEGEEKPF